MKSNYEFLDPFRKNCANIRLLLNSLAFVSVVSKYLVHYHHSIPIRSLITKFLLGLAQKIMAS